MNNIIKGALIIFAGFVAVMSSSFVTPGGSFIDDYPINNVWSASGTYNNTFTDAQGRLSIEDTNQGSGFFVSDTIDKENFIEIEGITFTSEQVKPAQNQVMDIKIIGISEGSIDVVRDFSVTENGIQSISTENLSEQRFNSYRFVINMETDSSDSPLLESLTIQGHTFPREDPLSNAIMWFMFFLGFYIIINGTL